MLDKDQKQAIEHDTGPCLVLAGPGSGKTTVIVERLKFLIKEKNVPPESIMVVTFTRESAAEMKERFYKALFDSGDHGIKSITFGTFHSIFFSFLRSDKSFRDFKILTGKNKLLFMKEVASSLSMLQNEREDTFDLLSGDISKMKNFGGRDLSDGGEKCGITHEDFQKYYSLYEKRKSLYGLLDFDDMLTIFLKKLESDNEFLSRLHRKYSYFLVDEAQDMNLLQYKCVQKLSGERRNVFLVGDDDQSIYSFRGADPMILKKFTKESENVKVISIRGNYRCAEKVVTLSSKLIRENKNRFEKTLESRTGMTGKITMIMHMDEAAQDGFVLRHIKKFLSESNDKTIAVLARNRSETYEIMDHLKNEGINYYSPFSESSGKGGELTDFILKDISAYLRNSCVEEGKPYKREDLIFVMNKPDRRIPRYGLSREEVFPESWVSSFSDDEAARGRVLDFIRQLKTLRGFSPETAVKFIINVMGYNRVIEDFLKHHPEKRNAVEMLLSKIEDLSRMCKRKDDLLEAIEKYFEERSAENSGDIERKAVSRVFLYTYHGSKGLQFDEVVLLSVNETVTPSKKAIEASDIEEERRMFYVAMTRAKEKILFSCVKKRGKDYLPPSRFLYEMSEKVR